MSDDEELLDVGGPRSRVLLAGQAAWRGLPHRRWIAGAVAALLLIATLTNTDFGAHSKPRAAANSSVATATATPAAPTSIAAIAPAPDASPVVSRPKTIALDRLVVRAESAQPVVPAPAASSTSRCPRVPAGIDPARAVVAALSHRLPEFTRVDTSVSLGPNGSLCELDVRARNPLGAMVVVSIVAPPRAHGPALAAVRSNDRTTVRDIAVFSGGWRVEAGWVAQTGAQIAVGGLKAVAHDRQVRW